MDLTSPHEITEAQFGSGADPPLRVSTRLLRLMLPILAAALALGVAIVGALLAGSDTGGVNGFVESLSGDSSTFLGDLGLLAPLGFAFAAGMVAAVNPCGFAMLPAYLGLYLGSGDTDGRTHLLRHVGRALLVGGLVTVGFVLLFGVAGLCSPPSSMPTTSGFPGRHSSRTPRSIRGLLRTGGPATGVAGAR